MSETPAVVEDLALGAFRLVKERLDFELDFTPETLPVLDHYLAQIREEDGGRPDEKAVALVGPCAGAYFGEVVRRSAPGLRWHCPENDYEGWRLEGEHVFLSFNPIGAALEALFGGPVPGWNAHITLRPEQRPVVDGSLEATGPIREDDFYRLAIRHEVLEQTLRVLDGLSKGNGASTAYGPEDYAAASERDGGEG